MLCPICERGCRIERGHTGACGRYTCDGERIVERFPDRYLITSPISVETIPLLHFYPGAPFFQISTVGCNFHCPGCIATVTAKELRQDSPALRHVAPEAVVNMALERGCRGIAFLMNDPLASYFTFLNVARAAKAKGLLVTCASNAFFTETSLAPLLGMLDGINIGVKGVSKEGVGACGGADPEVVLRNIRALHDAGTHVEVACMERLDNRDDTRKLAELLAAIAPNMVLQLMRYVPLETADPALEPSIEETEAFARELRRMLPFTYVFNTPGTRGLDTLCPECGERIIARDFYGPMGARLLSLGEGVAAESVRCGHCGAAPGVRGAVTPPALREADFLGGYPFTRGLEIVEAMCLAMGGNSQTEVVQAWEHLLAQDMLTRLHKDIQNIQGYFGLIRYFGQVIDHPDGAERLVAFLSEMITPVTKGVTEVAERPRTYYAMGKPLFAIKPGRFENHLVRVAGGESLNAGLDINGRPGISIEPATLQRLDPEVIFISSFLSNKPEDFCRECKELGLDLSAVRTGRVYTSPVPSSDFGAPKWVIGLRYLANKLHPDHFHFDIQADTARYHQQLFGEAYPLETINRSFSKPSRIWHFKEAAEA